MVNIWNAYQTMVTFNLSRSASYFESGIGRGMASEIRARTFWALFTSSREARQRLLDLAATQLPDRWGLPSVPAAHQTRKRRHRLGFNDDPLWLVLATSAYIKETGDEEILEALVPYRQSSRGANRAV